MPLLVGLVVVPLSLHPVRKSEEARWIRRLTLAIIGLVSLANAISLALLVHHLLRGHVQQGRSLIYSAMVIWFTNVIIFALWLWETDRGGPSVRGTADEGPYDLQFPQLENPQLAPKDWQPSFLDYAYVALTNGTSFGPTDALPLSVRAKLLLGSQSRISLITIAVVAARAVNILH